MYKFSIIILLITVIFSTIYISIKKPQLHKSVLIYNSSYKIKSASDVSLTKQTIKINQKSYSDKANVAIVPQKQIQQQRLNIVPLSVNTNTLNVKSLPNKTANKSAKTHAYENNNNVTPEIDVQKILTNNAKILEQKNNIHKQTVQTSQIPKVQSTSVKPNNQIINTVKNNVNSQTVTVSPQMTNQEEEIAWNIWRSNLQNKIMDETKLPPVPMGTVFRFSFDVDKYGRISNIQTWSDTSQYTPYAIQFIAPVIKSCQGRSILVFPSGTKRVSTKFLGAWKISTSSKYSTPQDYNDIEKVVK